MNGHTVSSVERRFGGASGAPSSGSRCSAPAPSLFPAIAATPRGYLRQQHSMLPWHCVAGSSMALRLNKSLSTPVPAPASNGYLTKLHRCSSVRRSAQQHD